jgi:ubiquinone/menaquinone biosynthesis C-methylase UbiE
MSRELVRNYYAAFGDKEWDRLTWPEGAIEFAITTYALNKYLPECGRVLDIGGGPGRYSIWLAQHGYRVVLADLSPNLLDIARIKIAEAGVQSHIEDVLTCDVCDMARFEDESFDALLCLGPFYHLVQAADRARAMQELVRVLKPQGVAFVAFMPIYTFLRRTLALKDERRHLSNPEFISRLMNDGVFLNDVAGRFNAGFGVLPRNLAPFMEQYGLQTLDVLADTGFAASLAGELQDLASSDPQTYQKALALIIDTANDPSLLGASVHLLYVGLTGKNIQARIYNNE